MKKNISINIGGIIFHIEEDGYDKLKQYLDSINSYFSSFDGSREIIEDIEGRIAEIFLTKLDEGKEIITIEDIDELIQTMGTTKDFEANLGAETAQDEEPNQEEPAEKEAPAGGEKTRRLYRDRNRTVIGGVASGLAYYLKVDPIWIRLIFIAALINLGFGQLSGFAFLTYVVLWVAVPGSFDLTDDKKIKKLFRDKENNVFGGVSGGLAAYFGTDPVLIRILFILGVFAGGAGIITYIILWIITPEAKTITEKMQMQGEPVTLNNIEENVKKSLNVKEGEEPPLVRLLLFPFRLIATVFKALADSLGPLMTFLIEALRILTGALLVVLGFSLMLAGSIALSVLIGIGGAWEHWAQFGGFTATEIYQVMGAVGLAASYVALLVPSAALILGGITIILKRSIIKTYIVWSLLGIWILSLLVLGMTLPSVFGEFKEENDYRETRAFPVQQGVPTLALNNDSIDEFDRVELKLKGHADTTSYKLVLDYESRGPSRTAAKEYAQAIDYHVSATDSEITFDPDIDFQDAPFRFQEVTATLYIPYDKPFRMSQDLEEILRHTLYPNGYRASQMENNDWVMTRDGILCTTCEGEDENESRFLGDDTQTYSFVDFDEIKLVSFFEFEIKKGETYKVEIEGSEKALEDLIIEQHGDELEIKRDRNVKWWDMNERDKIEISIQMPELEFLEVTGASEGNIEGFQTEEMEIRLTGASEIEANISPQYLTLNASGASEVDLSGRAEEMDVSLTGASTLDAFGFVVDDADIQVLGASTAKVFVTSRLISNAAGASSVKYKGSPRVTANNAGFSSTEEH